MNIIFTVSGFYSNATDAVAYYKELVMALFSKKDKYIRINPNRSAWKETSAKT